MAAMVVPNGDAARGPGVRMPPVGAPRLIARVSRFQATFELAGHNASGEALYTVRFEPLPTFALRDREGC